MAQGAVSPVEVLRLRRAEAQTHGQLDATTLAIPRAESAIKEMQRKVDETRGKFRSEALTQLNEARTELNKAQATGKAWEDRVSRTLVTSPVCKPYYQSYLTRGLKGTQALVILARKLARVMFALMKNQSEYRPDSMLGVPPKHRISHIGFLLEHNLVPNGEPLW